MQVVKFVVDYRGVLTDEVLFYANETVAFPDEQAEALVAHERAEYVVEDEGDAGPTLMDVPGVGARVVQGLERLGIDSIDALAEADPDRLVRIHTVGPEKAAQMIEAAQELAQDIERAKQD